MDTKNTSQTKFKMDENQTTTDKKVIANTFNELKMLFPPCQS